MKKKVIPAVVTALLAVLPAPLIAVNTIIHNATYDFINMTLGSDTLGGVTYTTIQYDDFYNDGLPGMPSLPVDYIRFSVPWNATNFTVTASLQNNLISNIDHLVYPCQLPRLMNDTTPKIITLPDSSAYYSNNYYPTQNAWVVNEGFLAGENHIVTVAIMPISYQHRKTGNIITNKLRMSQTVRLTLSYELRDSLGIYPIIRQDSALRIEGYELTRRIVVNPANVQTYAPVNMIVDSLNIIIPNSGEGLNGVVDLGILNPNDTTSNHGGNYVAWVDFHPYLIVTTSDLEHSVRRIAALKRQKGYDVKVVTMNEVMNSPYSLDGDRIQLTDSTYETTNEDKAGHLRQYLKHCFCRYGTKFVLLVGDSVPYKTIPNSDPKETFDIITDMYYSDLNDNWDSYGKDHYPELYVGRILSHDPEQIDNYTDKLYRYELNPGDGDMSYLKNAFFLRGRDFSEETNYLNAANELSTFFPNQYKIFDSYSNNSQHPNGVDVINAIKNYRNGFTGIFNHGDTTRIMVYGEPKEQYISYIFAYRSEQYRDGLNGLTNKKYPMVFYALSCTNIPFDNKGDINLGESFTTGKDYGGPVYIGYTRSVGESPIVAIFYDFTQKLKKGYYQLGVADALSKGIYRMQDNRNEILSHAYLGDPALELWTDEPQQFSNISVTRNNNSITVSGLNADTNTDTVPTIIAFYYNKAALNNYNLGYYRTITTTSSSVTLNNSYPNSSIMVFKHNYLPYIAPLLLQNEEMSRTQYVIARDVTAGYMVDTNRTEGDFTIKNGAEYEIEASGTVTLQDGFSVEKGAVFAVYPSSF